MAAAILTQHLRQHEAGRASAQHEYGRAHFGGDLVETVCGAGRGLEKRGIDVGQVFDLEDTARWQLSDHSTGRAVQYRREVPG